MRRAHCTPMYTSKQNTVILNSTDSITGYGFLQYGVSIGLLLATSLHVALLPLICCLLGLSRITSNMDLKVMSRMLFPSSLFTSLDNLFLHFNLFRDNIWLYYRSRFDSSNDTKNRWYRIRMISTCGMMISLMQTHTVLSMPSWCAFFTLR